MVSLLVKCKGEAVASKCSEDPRTQKVGQSTKDIKRAQIIITAVPAHYPSLLWVLRNEEADPWVGAVTVDTWCGGVLAFLLVADCD